MNFENTLFINYVLLNVGIYIILNDCSLNKKKKKIHFNKGILL